MSSTATHPWGLRRRRALELARRTPHAQEILLFYGELLVAQERTAREVPVGEWLGAAVAENEHPRLRPDGIPGDVLHPHLELFLESVSRVGTDVIADACRDLLTAPVAERETWLADAVRTLGRVGEPDRGEPNVFLGRAFLEPVLTALALAAPPRAVPTPAGAPTRRCPVCGLPPTVAVLGDRPDALGERSLVCSSCSSSWRVPRLTCAGCGEADPDSLVVHAPESIPHARLEECRSCSRYIKSIDRRADGSAVPVVDDLATIELDLWAREHGLKRLRANVLEL